MHVLALAYALIAPAAMPSASVTCAGWPASCDGTWATAADDGTADARDDQDNDGPREYATPVEVDCPTPPEAPAAIASGECEEPPALDLWYRVSRSPDSELPAGSLAPAPRRARGGRGLTAGGAPDPGHLSAPDVQPLALVALPGLVPATGRDFADVTRREIPARALAPPDRPPRG
jgi:hypothetical protein